MNNGYKTIHSCDTVKMQKHTFHSRKRGPPSCQWHGEAVAWLSAYFQFILDWKKTSRKNKSNVTNIPTTTLFNWHINTHPNLYSIYGMPRNRSNGNAFYRFMMTSSNGNIFRVTGHLCGKFTGPRWISRTKASDAELWCFLWFTSE